jgi:hypothetical protein
MLNSIVTPNNQPVNQISLADFHCWLTDNFGDACATIEFAGATNEGIPFVHAVGLDEVSAGQYFFEYDALVNGRVITFAGAHTAAGLARAIVELDSVVSFTCYEAGDLEPVTVGSLNSGQVFAVVEDELEVFAGEHNALALFPEFAHLSPAELPF